MEVDRDNAAMDERRHHDRVKQKLIGALPLVASVLNLVTGDLNAMNHNLAWPWNDACSRPQTPYLAFYSPQRNNLMFDGEDQIELRCQAGLRAVRLTWTLHRNLVNTPFREGVAEALPLKRHDIRLLRFRAVA